MSVSQQFFYSVTSLGEGDARASVFTDPVNPVASLRFSKYVPRNSAVPAAAVARIALNALRTGQCPYKAQP